MANMVSDKSIVVTGGGSGIGREFALGFAKHGANVIVNDIGKTKEGDQFLADIVAEEIRAAGGTAVASTDNITELKQANRIIESAVDNFGKIDGVINNAGIVRDRFIFKMSEDEWRSVLDVHLNGSFNMIRSAAPFFKEQNGGSFVNMTSTSGLIGNIGQGNYAAAKMGIVGLSKSTALDMAKFGVRSNCIAPWAWTAMTQSIPADTPENIARIEKMKKMEAHKIAPLAVYLCGDQSKHVSGQIFGVRANEIYFFSQIRMARSVQRSDGWTPEDIAEHAMPAFEASFYDNVQSMTTMPWDPI